MSNLIASIEEIDHHRNGVSGEPFWAVRFTDADTGEPFLGICFEECRDGIISLGQRVAVLSVPRLSGPEGVAFGRNSWRGDRYAFELRDAIRKHSPESFEDE